MSTTINSIAIPNHKSVTAVLRHFSLAIVFAILCLQEFASADGDSSILYRPFLEPFRPIDLLVLMLVFVHLLFFLTSRRSLPRIPMGMGLAGTIFCGCVLLEMIYGYSQGGRNLFFDWRDAALGVGLGFVVVGYWVRTPSQLRDALYLLATIWMVRVGVIWIGYLLGGGVENVPGIRSPIYDGPTLSATVFMGVLALRMRLEDTTPFRRSCWTITCLSCYVLVALALRRTFWGELLVATIIVLFRQSHKRFKSLTLAVVALVAIVVMLGPEIVPRIKSMDVSDQNQQYAATNEDHLNDILDAWDQIRESPVMGLGLGKPYQTLRISSWKKESWGVHNAPLHVWLRYGLLGLISYLWFHRAMFRWLRRSFSEQPPIVKLTAEVVFAYLVGQFVVSLGFSPWPYGAMQATALIFFLLGSLMAIQGSALTE